MKECTYYDLLGVPMDATDEEITNAKNFLVKRLHPDANIDSKFDTTTYIQNILYAYSIRSPYPQSDPQTNAWRKQPFTPIGTIITELCAILGSS